MSSTSSSTPVLTTSVEGSRRGRIWRMISGIMRQGLMGESPMRVREAVTERIEERRNEWAHSLPVISVDLAWHALIVLFVLVVLVISRDETASWNVRSWIVIYAIRYLIHMHCAFMIYMRTRHTRSLNGSQLNSGSGYDLIGSDNPSSPAFNDDNARIIERLNNQATYIGVFSVIWSLIGYCLFSDYSSTTTSTLSKDDPMVYWLFLGLLCLDFFFLLLGAPFLFLKEVVAFFIVMYYLPCILSSLYVIVMLNYARSEVDTRDIERLPTLVLRTLNGSDEHSSSNEHSSEIRESFWEVIAECDLDNPEAQDLHAENSECMICLCTYEDGSKLRQLPCLHVFHRTCIDRWLYGNPICPLCRRNIVEKEEQIDEE